MLLGPPQAGASMQKRLALKRVPAQEAVITQLKRANALPAIWFILSRKVCRPPRHVNRRAPRIAMNCGHV